MSAITLVLTEAGLDALVNAQAGNTANIQITQLALSDQAFTAAPTLTALPGEFKRVATFSGQSVSETVIHMTAQDSSEDVYDLRGFGLFLDDDTLFATYSQPDPLFTKVSIASFLFSVDVAFADTMADNIDFGDATYLYPPASETVKGVAEIATQDEVDDGTDDSRIITPLKLATRLAEAFGAIVSATELLQGVAEIATQGEVNAGTDDSRFVTPLKLAGKLEPLIQSLLDEASTRQTDDSAIIAALGQEADARGTGDAALQALIDALQTLTITGSGLVTGGGNLSASRTLTVARATGEELQAAAITNKGVAPSSFGELPRVRGASAYEVLPGGTLIQHGRNRVTTSNVQQSAQILFPIAFADTNYDLQLTTVIPGAGDYDNYPQEINGTRTTTGVTIWLQDPASGGSSVLAGFNWRAEGRI